MTTGKITYTNTNVDLEAFHRQFDAGLAAVRGRAGASYPIYVGGEAVELPRGPMVDRSPIDLSILGQFSSATAMHVDLAITIARTVQPEWARMPWRERVAILRRAAALMRERKFFLAALMALEVGKSRFESMGDVEEGADLVDYYCGQVEEADGFRRAMANPTPIERNTEVLRPYGVFACISPFNFPLALSAGMSSAALMAGNAVVYKPAEDTPWTGHELYQIYRDAGVPAGVFSLLTGHGSVIGDPLWQHAGIDGVVFTGSKPVGMRIFQGLSTRWIKPCLMELGGKNATVVSQLADLEKASEGVMRSGFGLQGQKCSATSRVYVERPVAEEFTARLLEKTRGMTIGDPTERDGYFGPVINDRAVKRYQDVVSHAAREAIIHTGGKRLTGGIFDRGYFVAPTVVTAPLESRLFVEEFFLPIVAIGVVESFDQAIAETNQSEYGLTAGVFSEDSTEVERFFERVEAGVCYANKRTGATTGAWPGAQPFCGWKSSGSSGKGGCGPYYVQQFMREQSRTVVR